MFYKIIFPIIFLPYFSFADFSITEIMYDLSGGDSGFEWIEVLNNSSSEKNLSEYRFREAEVNHKISFYSGSENISAGSRAVIADNPEKFLEIYSNFSGNLFDSSFSLSNEGENLDILNENLEYQDSVFYQKDWGANGDGNSLSLISGDFKPREPTPAEENSSEVLEEISEDEEDTDEENENFFQEESSLGISGLKKSGEEKNFFSANSDISLKVFYPENFIKGAETELFVEFRNLKDREVEVENVVWFLGNGDKKEGEKISYTYDFVGNYLVTLEIFYREEKRIFQFEAEVVLPEFFIEKIDFEEGFIYLKNSSEKKVDLSGWKISAGENIFEIPEHTYILGKNQLILKEEILNFSLSSELKTEMLYPSGLPYFSYEILKKTEEDLIKQELEKDLENNFYLQAQEKKFSEEVENFSVSEKEEVLEEEKKENILKNEGIVLEKNEKSFLKENLFIFIFIIFLIFLSSFLVFYKKFSSSEKTKKKKKALKVEDFEIEEIK